MRSGRAALYPASLFDIGKQYKISYCLNIINSMLATAIISVIVMHKIFIQPKTEKKTLTISAKNLVKSYIVYFMQNETIQKCV